MAMYDTLLHIDRYTEEWVPYLAESWTVSGDARDWTFRLKQGVPFYKNKQPTQYSMTVADVIHSFAINWYPPYQAGIPGISVYSTADDRHFDVKSDHEFVWKLDAPALFWGYYSTDDRRGVASKGYWDEVGEDAYIADPIGTGPFTFKDYAINQGLLVERVEDHYRQTPMFHELQYFYVPEEATRSAMLYTNEADISEISLSLHEQATARGFQIVNSTTPSFYTFMFIGGMYDASRTDGYNKIVPGFVVDENSPMRIREVREAINLAINREELNEVFLNGDAIATTRWAFPPSWTNYDTSWTPYPYDPDRARQLLRDAGYPNGFEIEVYAPPGLTGLPQAGEMSEAIAQYFEQIGLQAKIIPVNTEQMSSIPRNREYSRGVIQTRFGTPFKGGFTRQMKGNINYRQEWQQHQEIYDYVERLESVSDWPTLEAMEVEAANWVADNHLFVPLFWVVGQVAINPDVVASYESRHLHMGPSRHHEYTVPVYK